MGPFRDKETGLTFYHYGDDGAPAGAGKGVQSINEIVTEFNSTSKPFVDPYFPPDASSLGNLPSLAAFRIKWLRPKEIMKEMFPESEPIFHGPFDQFGVNQGAVGDCWLLAVMADAAMKPEVINTLVPADNAKLGFDVGAFHFRFWCRGKWMDVVVDSYLPCLFYENVFYSTAFTKPTVDGGFWASFVEKAYAKIYGTYESIEGGWSHEAMEDFTGGLVMQYDVKKLGAAKFETKVRESLENNNMMAIATNKIPADLARPHDPNNPGQEDISKDGIVGGHAYSLLDIQDFSYKSGKGKITLVKCRNPWGNKEEWMGDFSDKDPDGTWKTVTQDLRTGRSADGQFWIPITDLVKYGSTLYDCRWCGNYRGDKTMHLIPGILNFIDHGNFTKANSGSRKGFHASSYAGKAGYCLQLKSVDKTKTVVKGGLDFNCKLVINMMYKNYTLCGVNPDIPIYGFQLLWAPGHHKPKKGSQFFHRVNFKVLQEPTCTNKQREINIQVDLPEGTAFIVPWIEEWDGVGAPYFLRIVCEGEVSKISPEH